MAKPRSPKQRAREAKRTPAAHAAPAPAAAAPNQPMAPQAEPVAAIAPVEAPVAAFAASAAPTHDDANSAAHGADHHTPSDDHDAEHATTGHGHHETELGPFDVVMWTFGMVGVMLGILIWAAFAIATTAI